MRKTAITLASFVVLTMFPSLASAQNRTAVGVGTGAVAGAVIGGPIGAAVGGVVGGVIGASTDQRRYRAYRNRSHPIQATEAIAAP